MEPDRLLETWTSIHGSLTVAQQQSFLERLEVEELCQMPDAAVVHAVGKASTDCHPSDRTDGGLVVRRGGVRTRQSHVL